MEAQRGRAALEGGDVALSLLIFVSLLTLIDELFAAGEHEVHHPRQFVRGGGVGARLVHAAAQAAVERAQRGVAARQAHRCHLQRLGCSVG